MKPEIHYENGVFQCTMPEGDKVFSYSKDDLKNYLEQQDHSRPLTERQVERIAFAAMVVGVVTLAMVVTAALAWFGKVLGEG